MDFSRIALFVAGLAGASGVAFAAYAAHAGGDNLKTASQMLLFHAPALLALSALASSALRKLSIGVMAVGLVLFCGDLVMREMSGSRLFPMAAPIGGSSLILAWVLIALSSLLQPRLR
ncbi:MAG: DUF423 domain-containing protein [Notoacmeibacter sp.]|nr:DUF423 domain-containing protein [Notoacmeibacter sp.]